MPNLSSVSIRECSKLEMILDGMKSLKELRMFNDRIQVVNGEGVDFHKAHHVPLISLDDANEGIVSFWA
jgi:hypothetical protein